MYPFLRMFKEMVRARRMPALGLFDTHVSHHICWPWDLDPWVELNNGRTLTLYDLGRLPLGARTGIHKYLVANRWGMTVAGSSVRYRRRVTMFSRLTTYSRCLGWDDRFLYTEQSMWKGDDCASQVLIRSAIVGASGIVPPSELAKAAGVSTTSPELPDWVKAWIAAEATRPRRRGPGHPGADPAKADRLRHDEPSLAKPRVSGFTSRKNRGQAAWATASGSGAGTSSTGPASRTIRCF